MTRSLLFAYCILGLFADRCCAQGDTLFVYLNTGTCAAHSKGLASIEEVSVETTVILNLTRADSLAHQAILRRLGYYPLEPRTQVRFLRPDSIAKHYTDMGLSSFRYSANGERTIVGPLDKLAELMLEPERSAGSVPPAVTYAFTLATSESVDLWSNDSYTYVLDDFLGANYLLDQKNGLTGSMAYNSLDSGIALSIGKALALRPPSRLLSWTVQDVHFASQASDSILVLAQAVFGETDSTAERRSFVVQYANGSFHSCAPLGILPEALKGYAMPTPGCVGWSGRSFTCRYGNPEEESPWGKRFFIRFTSHKDSMVVDDTYLGCPFPKGLEDRGFGSFLSSGHMSGLWNMCGIAPILTHVGSCEEIDLSDALGLSGRDIGMLHDSYYTRGLAQVGDQLHVVYVLHKRIHHAVISLPTRTVVFNEPIDAPPLNWMSMTISTDGKLVALNDERNQLVFFDLLDKGKK